MDTEDPVLKVSGGRDNDGKKKGKKKRDKMISLDEFEAKHGGFGGTAAPVANNSWAVMTENTEEDDSYKFDRSLLPSAPKAALEPTVDLSQIPAKGPFSAYIGNLSYDANEEDLHRLFSKLEVDNVRIITDGGRPRGYAYVDFVTKESLIEALSYNEREWMNRSIRVDLATDKNIEGGGRQGGPGGNRSNEPDRTEGDWRRKDDTDTAPSNSFGSRDDRDSRSGRFGGDRDRDRGYGFGRDRDRDGEGRTSGGWRDRAERGFGDRDRGFGGDRDRGFGGDRDRGFGGDRDRGFGGDRDRGFGGGRDRGYGDRDRGFGGDRDRGYGRDRDFGGDRDGGRFSSRGGGYDDSRYSSRQNNGYDRGSRDGSRDGGFDRDSRSFGGDRDRDGDRGGRFSGSRGGGYEDRGGGYGRRDDYGRGNRQDDGRPRSRDGSLEHKSEAPKERPKLNLQKRSKPVEQESQPDSTGGGRASSIFGAAKPVDTYAKEKEIEEKLKKKDVGDRDDPRRREEDSSRPRRSAEDGGADRRRKISSGSGGSEWTRNTLPVQKPPPHAGRRSSEDNVSTSSENPKSPTSPKPAESLEAKMVPAPPPKQNAWAKKPPAAAPASGARDASNNAAASSQQAAAGPKRDERRDDRRPPAGRGKDKDNKDRRPGGARTNGDGAGDHQQLKKHQREKKLPKSIEEMPKYEEDRSRDFSTMNKFSFLMDGDNEGDFDDDNNDGKKDATSQVSSS